MRWRQDLGPADILVPTRKPCCRPIDDVRSLLGPGAIDWAHPLVEELTRDYVEVPLPDLARSLDFTRVVQLSVESNVLGLLLDTGLTPNRYPTAPGSAAVRRRSGCAAGSARVLVLRGYQLALEHWLQWCAPAIARRPNQNKELQLAVSLAVRYVDRLSDTIIVEYERELQRRTTSGAARRAALVGALLDGDVVDVEDASTMPHYPLRAKHVALALRVPDGGAHHVSIPGADHFVFDGTALPKTMKAIDDWLAPILAAR